MQLKLIALKWKTPFAPIKTLQGHKRAHMRPSVSFVKRFEDKIM